MSLCRYVRVTGVVQRLDAGCAAHGRSLRETSADTWLNQHIKSQCVMMRLMVCPGPVWIVRYILTSLCLWIFIWQQVGLTLLFRYKTLQVHSSLLTLLMSYPGFCYHQQITSWTKVFFFLHLQLNGLNWKWTIASVWSRGAANDEGQNEGDNHTSN